MHIQRLSENSITEARQLISLFGEAFEEVEHYNSRLVTDKHLHSVLKESNTIVLVAIYENMVVGGLVAYVLKKIEGEQCEIYLYDLAVVKTHRRQGIATKLIEELKTIGAEIGASVVFVQADNVDKPALALYDKIADSKKNEVTHFDILIHRHD